MGDEKLTDDDLDRLASHRLNGRQVRRLYPLLLTPALTICATDQKRRQHRQVHRPGTRRSTVRRTCRHCSRGDE